MDNSEIKATSTDIRSETARLLLLHSKQPSLVDIARRKSNRRSDKQLKAFDKKMEQNQSKQPQSQVVFWIGFIVVLIVIIWATI